MANSQNMSQPHIRKKLETSGALETFKTAKVRAHAMRIIESGGLDTYANSAKDMITHPEKYIHGSLVSATWLNFYPFLEKGIISKRNPHRGAIDETEQLLKQAEYSVGRAQVSYANTLEGSGHIIHRTQGQVKMILSGIGM